ncbi:MAG: diguanylate cyclase [Chloroflexota bacterium]
MQAADVDGRGGRGRWGRLHRLDIVLLATISGAMFATAWLQADFGVKLMVWGVGIIGGVYIFVLRALLRSPYARHLLPLRIAITCTLCLITLYLLHDSIREAALVFLVPILLYATRFGSRVGAATAAVSSLAVIIMWALRQGATVEALPVLMLYVVSFFMAGLMAGSVTTELMRRNRESASKMKELEGANRALAEDRGEIERLNEELLKKGRELELLAATDTLTGLVSRRHFEEVLGQEFQRAERYKRKLALLTIDVDGLKTVNDNNGHHSGDAVLVGVAEQLRLGLRTTDLAARYGGDEFAALLAETDCKGALQVAERIYAGIANRVFRYMGVSLRVGVSIGTACYPSPGIASEDDLLRAADNALCEVKKRKSRSKRDGG